MDREAAKKMILDAHPEIDPAELVDVTDQCTFDPAHIAGVFVLEKRTPNPQTASRSAPIN